MCTRVIVLLALAAGSSFGADWNPKLAADYLDARQKAWIAWPVADHNGAPCISCHTNLTYLLARPALSRALRQDEPNPYQTKLLDSLRRGLSKATPPESPALGVEAVLAALLLANTDAGPQALDRMWTLQIAEGKNAGAWNWFSLDLDPWEEPESAFYGASLAAAAAGMAPEAYRSRPEVHLHLDSLKAFLTAQQASQPAHNRLALLWAAAKWPGLLSGAERKSIVDSVLARQAADGGWTVEAIGPWKAHPNAPASAGSNAYATAWAAFALQHGGVPRTDPAMRRALDWLRSHQDAQTGAWAAASMNKHFEPDSMQVQFMRDAATGFAALALLSAQ
jgi:squalene-hopene/tetraprenyl-beta-curcumene cyclase